MASPTLAELQYGLAALILDRRDVGIEPWVVVPTGVEVATRVAVYTDGYAARIQEALLETFPAVAKILGDGSLASLVDRYREHIPTGWCNLNFIGRALPDFLASDQLSQALPFLPDLARLEWHVVECFHARVDEPFDLAAAATWDLDEWAGARIRFQPGVALVTSPWPIHELRAAREGERSEIDIDLVARPQSVWIYRRGFEVVTEALDEVETGISEALLEGRTIGDVMSAVAARGADAGSVLGLFSRFATLGLIAECRSAKDST
jgi:hypothetical protein